MSGALHKLSARQVETASEPKRYGDGGGLYLSVKSKTSKRWVFLFRWGGKLTEMGLGSATPGSRDTEAFLPPASRQQKCGTPCCEHQSAGGSPRDGRHLGGGADLRRVCRRVHLDDGEGNGEREAQSSVGNDPRQDRYRSLPRREERASRYRGTSKVLKAIRAKPIDQVDTDDIMRLLKPIWTIKPETANRTRGRVENVIDAAKAAGKRSGENPARWRGHLDKLLPKRSMVSRGHHAAMPYEEVPAFIAACTPGRAVAARALEFTILTAARTEETIGATWSEVDLRKRLWVVPKERMKARKEHRVPLSLRACEILRELEPLAPDLDSPFSPTLTAKHCRVWP